MGLLTNSDEGIEEVQFFLLLHPEDGISMSIPDKALLNFAMIKINKKEIYSKALEHWNAKERVIWPNLCTHMIKEYKKLLCEGGGTTLGQEDYGQVFNAVEEADNALLAESIVQYAERASTVESKVSQ